MINLLSYDNKRDIRAARANVLLFRYVLMTLGFIGFLGLSCVVFYLILDAGRLSAISTNTQNTSEAAKYADIRTDADEYRNNLTIAKEILDGGTSYIEIINTISTLLPSGVVLDSIDVSNSDFNTQTVFSAHAKSYEQAIQLKEQFEKSELFSNVFFQTLARSDASGGGTSSNYPISVSISAKLNKVNE